MTNISYATPQPEKSSLFRNALRFDGVITVIIGLTAIIGANALYGFFGLSDSATLVATGAFLFAYSLSMLYFGQKAHIPNSYARFTTSVDFLWAIGSYAIALTGAFGLSDGGRVFLFLSACMVIVIGTLKYRGLPRL